MLALANIALLVIFQLRHLHPDALTGGNTSKVCARHPLMCPPSVTSTL